LAILAKICRPDQMRAGGTRTRVNPL
jgi:hypothetical protein